MIKTYRVATAGLLALPFHLAMTRPNYAPGDVKFGRDLDWFLEKLSADYHISSGEEKEYKEKVLNAVYTLRRGFLKKKDLAPVMRYVNTIGFQKFVDRAFPATCKYRLCRRSVAMHIRSILRYSKKTPLKMRTKIVN